MKTTGLIPPSLRVVVCASLMTLCLSAPAQQRGKPGVFDFYLLNLSWSPEFCSIQGTSPECAAHPGFVVHGLWPQNFDGSYPVTCSKAKGPKNYRQYLDITPDLPLLKHEWTKHGTCSDLAPDSFFQLERKDFEAVVIPPLLQALNHSVTMTSAAVLAAFASANPTFPTGSILLSCSKQQLTAVEICLAKDGTTPIACQGVTTCNEPTLTILPEVSGSSAEEKPGKQ